MNRDRRARLIAGLGASVLATGAPAAAQVPSQAPRLAQGHAQVPSPPPPSRYGPPIGLDQARAVGLAAMAEARRQGVSVAVAVVEPSGALVWFERADDTQYGSVDLAQRKAATAALYRRPTRDYYDAVSKGGMGLITLGVTASPGGTPILSEGRVVGAIGVSGGVGLQDAQIAEAGAGMAR